MSSPAELPRVALVQMEVLPGRPDLNVKRMLSFIAQARGDGAEVVAFSEMCVTGYILGDQWEVDQLVQDYAEYSDALCAASNDLVVIFGNVAVDCTRTGEDGRLRKYNAVFVCCDTKYSIRSDVPPGLPAGIQPKTLHPNYRFFEDDRHFFSLRELAAEEGRSVYDWAVPYNVLLPGGNRFRFGVQLCEDIWCQDYNCCGSPLDTLAAYHRHGAQAVFNLSASPWTWQKNNKRNQVIREILNRSPLPFYYVNQIGAQNNGKNIIVFDGDTTAYGSDGKITARAQPWTEQVLHTRTGGISTATENETASQYSAIISGLRHLDHIRSSDNRFLLGVSGGIDSSVVACLLTSAFGPGRVFAVNMPTRFNSEITQRNARQVSTTLNIDYLSCPIEDLYENLRNKLRKIGFEREPAAYTQLVDENVQARIRGSDILAGLAAKYGLVFTNNGNKTELALGYATLYGDVNGAVAPIADLYKVQVVAMARFLNQEIFQRQVVPHNLTDGETVPSAELSLDQDVTQALGDPIKYGYHDAVLRQFIEYRRHPVDLLEWYSEGKLLENIHWNNSERFATYFPDVLSWITDLEWLEHQVRVNCFKRVQAPPIIVLSKRAFGFDLRESQLPEYQPRRYADLKRQLLEKPAGRQ